MDNDGEDELTRRPGAPGTEKKKEKPMMMKQLLMTMKGRIWKVLVIVREGPS